MNLLISNTTVARALVIHVDGELDVYTAPLLKEAVDSALAQGHVEMVVDLTRVGFIDSTALGVLVGSLRRARAEDGDLRLVMNDPHLEKMFRITGFDSMFSIHRSVEDAIRGEAESAS
jgi:anti-sigma B factor antagonist